MASRGVHVRERKFKGKVSGHSWQIVIELAPCPVTGKRNRIFKSVSGVTQRQAEKLGRELLHDIETDNYVRTTNLTVEKYLREWHSIYILPSKSPTTSTTYLYNLESYIFPRFGKIKLQSLTTIEIQRWINDLSVKSPISDRPLNPKSIRNLYMNLNAALKRAVLLGYIAKNPAANVELPKCKSYKPEVYNADELQRLFEVAKGSDLEVGIMLLVCLGVRRGELLAMTWADVDFDNKLISINKSVVKIKRKETVIKDPKSEAGKRIIECPDVLMDFLRYERVAYWERKLKLGADYNDHNLVVCQSDGSPYNPDYFSGKFKQLLERNGLKVIRLHDLRHSHATFMLRLGVNVKAMQKRMGHSTFATTMDIYSHVLEDLGREAADTLNVGLQGIMPTAKVR